MKQELKSLQTKQKIKQAALSLFFEKGYSETKMSDIVDVTNLSKGAVYHHFSGKEEILKELMTEEMDKLTLYLKELTDKKEESAKERLLGLLDTLLLDIHLNQLSRLNWADKVPYGLLTTLRNTVNVLPQYLSDVITQGNQRGEFECQHPLETASIFLMMIDVWLDPVIAEDSWEYLSKKLDYIVYFLDRSGVPLVTDDKLKIIKDYLRKDGKENE